MNFFDFADTVIRMEPLDRQNVQTLFGQLFKPIPSNEYYEMFALDKAVIGEMLEVINIDLRVPRPGSGATGGNLLAVELKGQCITLNELQERYSDLKLFEVPRGRSHDEQTGYENRMNGRSVRFGFKESNSACLNSFVIVTSK